MLNEFGEVSLLRAFDKAVERFCYKHPRFGIPRLMLWIVILNAVTYLFSILDRTGTFVYYLVFDPSLILQGQVWRIITFLFVPTYANPFAAILSLYFYYFIGTTLENQWGQARFTVYYLCGVVFSLLYGIIASLLGFDVRFVMTGYYLNLSLFFAFATLWPDFQVLLFFIIPIKMKWLAIVDAAFFVVSMILERSLFPLMFILNYLLFFSYILIERVFGRKAVWERKAQFKVRARPEAKEYRHKCAVCGRTDTDYPELEFRYCSRCVGYHCFCQDHINNHVHFTE